MRTLIGILALALLAVPARAQDKIDTAKAVEQAKAMSKAALDGDFATHGETCVTVSSDLVFACQLGGKFVYGN